MTIVKLKAKFPESDANDMTLYPIYLQLEHVVAVEDRFQVLQRVLTTGGTFMVHNDVAKRLLHLMEYPPETGYADLTMKETEADSE